MESLAEKYYGAMKAAAQSRDTLKALCFAVECTWGDLGVSTNVFVSAYGLELPVDPVSAENMLGNAAAEVAAEAGFTFRARRRASHKYKQILLAEDGNFHVDP